MCVYWSIGSPSKISQTSNSFVSLRATLFCWILQKALRCTYLGSHQPFWHSIGDGCRKSLFYQYIEVISEFKLLSLWLCHLVTYRFVWQHGFRILDLIDLICACLSECVCVCVVLFNSLLSNTIYSLCSIVFQHSQAQLILHLRKLFRNTFELLCAVFIFSVKEFPRILSCICNARAHYLTIRYSNSRRLRLKAPFSTQPWKHFTHKN